MILKPYYLACLSHASYLIADEESATAAVVDPQRDVDQYLEDAATLGVRIGHVFLTHFHADFLAGHLEIQGRTGADIRMGRQARTEFPVVAMGDGDSLEMGRVRFSVLETPGHTPEGISILVYDLQRHPQRPHAVLTGDTLFIGDVGRPDLMASKGMTAEELARMMYRSLHDKLLALPDETLVYPAHGAGSMCGKNLSTDTVSTIGAQRRANPALRPMSEEEFVRMVTEDQPPAPAYFPFDAELNRRMRPTLDESLRRSLRPLSLDQVLERRGEGAQILDVRDPDAFAAGHLAGSINIGLGGKYATWAGTVLSRERPIVLVADPGREAEAAMRLGRIGFDHVDGYLQGGPETLTARPAEVRRNERIDSAELRRRLGGDAPPLVLDIRAAGERASGAIPGSLHIPLAQLMDRRGEIPAGRSVVIHCASGYRSSIAASLLAAAGQEGLSDLAGGYQGWERTAGAARSAS